MGEEEKKPEPEVVKSKEEPPKPAAPEPADDGKKEEAKSEDSPPPPAPPPPQEIVLKVFMHCEACARKVRGCLKGFEGVEEVITDCRTSKVVVKGEKADPAKVLERVQKKSHRQVELISPIPKHPSEEPQKPPEKEPPNPPQKKQEPRVITVVLGVYMHCEACAQEIKRRIQRMKGVESAEPDLRSSKVTVKGAIEAEKLRDYVYKRTGKHATIIQIEPAKKEEEEKDKEPEEEKKATDAIDATVTETENNEAKKLEQEAPKAGNEGSSSNADGSKGEAPAKPESGEDLGQMEVRKDEFYDEYTQNYQMYQQRFVHEMNAYPPQMFSDENPNACCVM